MLYAETGGRYPAYTAMRQELGNNGFCELTLEADQSISLRYRDWMNRDRARIRLAKANGTLDVANVETW